MNSRYPNDISRRKDSTTDQGPEKMLLGTQEERFSYIGRRIPRMYSREQATGIAKYTSDIYLPNMLHGKVLRSPLPHARIRNIDTSEAERLSGVAAVITAKDTPLVKFAFAPTFADKLFLEAEKVRYVGDEVAAVAAMDEVTAEKALKLIRVEYEELSPVFTPEEAMREGAPQIHEGISRNISAHMFREFGDIETGFKAADFVFEHQFQTSRVTSCCMETLCCVATVDFDGDIMVWACTQTPFPLVQQLAEVLCLPTSKIKVIQTYLGGAFGSREGMDPIDPICVLLAIKTKRPVKLKNTRKEEFETSRTRHPMKIYIKTGITKEGLLTARHIKIITDNGAYNSHGISVTSNAGIKASQLYRIPNFKYETYVVYTNSVYGGAMRGYGNPQMHFAIESQMDIIAERIGIDPIEFRLRNANHPGDRTVSGARITSCGLSECIEVCARELKTWSGADKEKKPKKPYRGFGFAAMIHTGGGNKTYGYNFSTVKVKINYDGTVNVYTGSTDLGEGSHIVILQIVAEELGVPLDSLKIILSSTDSDVMCMGTHGSRITFVAGNAAKLAAADAKRQIFEIASSFFKVGSDELSMKEGEIFLKENSCKKITLRDVIKNSYYDRRQKPILSSGGHSIIGWGIYSDRSSEIANPETGYGNINPTYSFGAQGVELDVDPETGIVNILRIVAVHDIGKVINLSAAEGQLYGGVLQGIGYALSEEISLDENGNVRQTNFLDYKILTAADIPEVNVKFVETIDPEGPFGAKGFGECPIIPTAAAIANAIYDATGIRFTEIPIKSENILKALKMKRKIKAKRR